MGLLDDAIREHLELKRRRGADPTEVARAEQEALGPVRREREAAPPAEEAGEPAAAETAAPIADAGPPVVDDQPEPPPLAEPDDATRVIPPAEAARAIEDDPGDQGDPGDPAAPPLDPPAEAERAPAPPAPAPRTSDIVDQPTTEFRVEDLDDLELDDRSHTPPAHATPEPPPAPERREDDAPPAAASDDVLEETPDFLQETPEHDRLWFEQRPPRDFDFDG